MHVKMNVAAITDRESKLTQARDALLESAVDARNDAATIKAGIDLRLDEIARRQAIIRREEISIKALEMLNSAEQSNAAMYLADAKHFENSAKGMDVLFSAPDGTYVAPGTKQDGEELPATSDPVPALSEEQMKALEADIAAAASPQQKEAA